MLVNLNKIVCSFYNHFWQRVDAILEDLSVPVAEIIV